LTALDSIEDKSFDSHGRIRGESEECCRDGMWLEVSVLIVDVVRVDLVLMMIYMEEAWPGCPEERKVS